MTNNTSLLLKLINEGKTLNEISYETNFSNRQIMSMLSLIKNKGFEFDRIFYYNGEISYTPKKSLIEIEKDGVNLITSSSDTEINMIAISDLHIASIKERPDLLVDLYEYCDKEGINIIVICGDIIDGTFGKFEKIYDNIWDQIDYLLKIFPYNKNILNFIIGGDHDFSGLENFGQNIMKVFENYRHDIISLGYGIGKINIKDDYIWVRHRGIKEVEKENLSKCLVLDGHSHSLLYQHNLHNYFTRVIVPAFSDFSELPTAIKIQLQFKNGKINYGIFEQLYFGAKTFTVSKFEIPLGYGKDISPKELIKLESEKAQKKVLTQFNKSRIESFNAKYKL